MDDETRRVLEAFMGRVDTETLVDRLEGQFAELPAYRRYVQPAATSAQGSDRGREAIRFNVEMVRRWVARGQGPDAAELAHLRELVRVRAQEGMPIDDGLLVYRQGARLVWEAWTAIADPSEQRALLDVAEIVFDYVNIVTDAFASAYNTDETPTVTEDRRARDLLERLLAPSGLGAEDAHRAEQLAFPLAESYVAFVATHGAGGARQHGELARRLRAAGHLASSDGERVAGLAVSAPTWPALHAGEDLLVAVAGPFPRAALSDALVDLNAQLSVGVGHGHHGVLSDGDYLAQTLMVAAPRHAHRIQRQVLVGLVEHPDLVATLRALVDADFDRARAAAALSVHRNTMLYRAGRIEQLTGLNLNSAHDRGLIWLATLDR